MNLSEKMLSLKQRVIYFGMLVTMVVSCFVFYKSFQFHVANPNPWVSDLPSHTQYVLKFTQSGKFPAYTLWYKLVSLLSGQTLHYKKIAVVSILLLAGLVAIKYLINYLILQTAPSTNSKLMALLSFILIFAMPILSYYKAGQYPQQITVDSFHVYLGNIAANQWHNATLILAMPFNLLLFYYALKYRSSTKVSHFFGLGLLAVLGILCKPNYALAFLPLYCLSLCLINCRNREYLQGLCKISVLVLPCLLVLIYQWYYTFLANDLFPHPDKTILAPFLVWKTYSPHILLSLSLSVSFPFMVALFYYQKMDEYLLMSWGVFLVALAMFSLLAEYPVYSNGNYWWGSIAANYILFLFSARLLLSQPFDWKAKIAYSVLGLHFLSGCFLLASFFFRHSSLIL
ncbi:hypothetical protein [Legionella massiliensis]|uniref:hypothetical protein n=1 Tax=Legionella massiliensis TaxID=1034943 RepID=UPI001146B323|nr:hypothetical protein [Legionella massiliensis]